MNVKKPLSNAAAAATMLMKSIILVVCRHRARNIGSQSALGEGRCSQKKKGVNSAIEASIKIGKGCLE